MERSISAFSIFLRFYIYILYFTLYVAGTTLFKTHNVIKGSFKGRARFLYQLYRISENVVKMVILQSNGTLSDVEYSRRERASCARITLGVQS